jgi:hypothetical protein
MQRNTVDAVTTHQGCIGGIVVAESTQEGYISSNVVKFRAACGVSARGYAFSACK